jgi:SAM-dependent methyltransferase
VPTYPPYDPELYALTHLGNPGDLAFYKKICEGAESVLELGCGAGRVGLHLAEAGHRVLGLDDHPGMLDRLAAAAQDLEAQTRKRLRWKRGDMAAFELGEHFERILIPYNGLYCLLTHEAVADCFAAVVRHLAPDGKLIFDAYRVFTPAADFEEPEDDPDPVACLTDGENVIEVFERSDWDKDAQLLTAHYRYAVRGPMGDRDEEYAIPQRYLSPDQIVEHLQKAGLVAEAWYGGFGFEPFTDDSETICLVATKGTDP